VCGIRKVADEIILNKGGEMRKGREMRKGFTLIELIIVVIIVGILATFAIPQYTRAVERTMGGKARHSLGLIAQGEKMFRAENDTYVDVAQDNANVVGGIADYVELNELDVDNDWNYTVSGASPIAFLATATRDGGPNNGEVITLDQDGVWNDSAWTP